MLIESIQNKEKRDQIESRFREETKQNFGNVGRADPSVYRNRDVYGEAPYQTNVHYLFEEQKLTRERREQQHRDTIKSVLDIPAHQPDHIVGPVKFILKLLATWNLESRDAVWLLGFEEADEAYVDDIMSGRTPVMGRDIKDRIACLFEIRRALSTWLRDDIEENEWLRERHHLLDDQSPMDLLREGSMENLFLVKEYTGMATGG